MLLENGAAINAVKLSFKNPFRLYSCISKDNGSDAGIGGMTAMSNDRELCGADTMARTAGVLFKCELLVEERIQS
jgi:hypothetical protein